MSEDPTTRRRAEGSAADAPLPARRPRSLFEEDAVSPEAAARDAVLRAFRDQVAEWLECYEPIGCENGVEPPRVSVRFVVRDGRARNVRVVDVTEFRWEPSGRLIATPGAADGRLARCLADFTRSLSIEMPSPTLEHEGSFVFRPEVYGCSR